MGVETRRAAALGRHKKSTPNIFSHDFVIQNHGDIVSCIVMLFVVGMMVPTTSNLCTVFVTPQYNQTVSVNTELGVVNQTVYSTGVLDLLTTFFYAISWIVVHAVIQEYILDKLQRKVHLSKIKTFKFTESGHQVIFALYSAIHAAYVIGEFIAHHSDIKKVWMQYPDEHTVMTVNMKVFSLIQIAYWLHQYPEFYFQKFKKEEMRTRGTIAAIYIALISAAYYMHFMRFAVVILFLDSASQVIFHFARLAHFMDKKAVAKSGFQLWNVFFLVVRMASIVLTLATFLWGLKQTEAAFIDVASGNYNTSLVRLNVLLILLGVQGYQFWSFMVFHVEKYKERNGRKKAKPAQQPLVKPKSKQIDDSEPEATEPERASKKQERKKKN